MERTTSLTALGIVLTTAACCSPCRRPPDGRRWWSHVAFLADDTLEGRDTGSAGHRKAAEYVAGSSARSGSGPPAPTATSSRSALKSRTIDEAHSRLALVRSGGEEPLGSARRDHLAPGRPRATVEAALVFAGYGLSIAEAGHDDFSGLDARQAGRLPSRRTARRLRPARGACAVGGRASRGIAQAGAIGVIKIVNPKHMDIPWERQTLARFMPSMSLADPAIDESRGLKAGWPSIRPTPTSSWPARVTDSARSSTRPTPASRCRTSRFRRRLKASVAVTPQRGFGERRGRAAGHRPGAQG